MQIEINKQQLNVIYNALVRERDAKLREIHDTYVAFEKHNAKDKMAQCDELYTATVKHYEDIRNALLHART